MFDIAIISDEIALDIREAIQHGLEMGINKYEIRCLGSYEKRIPFVDEKDLEFLTEQVESGKIEITAISPGSFKILPSEEDQVKFHLQEMLPKTFELAKRLRTKKVITFSFMKDTVDEDYVVDIIKKVGAEAAKHDLIVAVENEPGFYCDSGQATRRILDKINMDNVKVNWDPGNAAGGGHVAYPTGYEFVKPYIVNMHVKDAVDYPKLECKLLNDGSVNWLGQLNALYHDNILPYITLETHFLPMLESTQEDLRRLRILLETVEKLNVKS
ncbi:MAG: TIM barrel protein [Actinobacteria bacterium]|nr:TIM barrel protein [Actinomycetota bacterium]